MEFCVWIAIMFVAHCVNDDQVISAPIWRRSDHRDAAIRKRTVSETLLNAVDNGLYFANSIFEPVLY